MVFMGGGKGGADHHSVERTKALRFPADTNAPQLYWRTAGTPPVRATYYCVIISFCFKETFKKRLLLFISRRPAATEATQHSGWILTQRAIITIVIGSSDDT